MYNMYDNTSIVENPNIITLYKNDTLDINELVFIFFYILLVYFYMHLIICRL